MNGAPLKFEQLRTAARLIQISERLPDPELLSLVEAPMSRARNFEGLDLETQRELVAIWALQKWTGSRECTLADVEFMQMLLARSPFLLMEPFSPAIVAAAGVH